MNIILNRTALLTKLSKLYVFTELGLDPKTFARTPDTAWIGFADRLLRVPSASSVARETPRRQKVGK